MSYFFGLNKRHFLKLFQEKKFKSYKSGLEMLLSSYKKTLNLIPDHLFGLFVPHIKQTLDLSNQGCCILTWNSLNIDSFVKIFENGIKKLNDLVLLIRDEKEANILQIINEIHSNTPLLDSKLAFSKHWVKQIVSLLVNVE
jgi:hypothetical protein